MISNLLYSLGDNVGSSNTESVVMEVGDKVEAEVVVEVVVAGAGEVVDLFGLANEIASFVSGSMISRALLFCRCPLFREDFAAVAVALSGIAICKGFCCTSGTIDGVGVMG